MRERWIRWDRNKYCNMCLSVCHTRTLYYTFYENLTISQLTYSLQLHDDLRHSSEANGGVNLKPSASIQAGGTETIQKERINVDEIINFIGYGPLQVNDNNRTIVFSHL